MGEAQQLQLTIIPDDNEQKQGVTPSNHGPTTTLKSTKISRWIRISMYTVFLLVGQVVATLLGRLYFQKGGNSKWLQATIQVIGFPILLPLYFLLPPEKNSPNQTPTISSSPCSLKMSSIYTVLGLLMAANTMFYTYGLQYLPVTTYTLISASQLAFNAVFSYVLNGQNLTPYVVNSVVLLTISSILLVFQKSDDPSTDSTGNSHEKYYAIGFIFTLVASAGYSLMLSLSQLVFQRVLKGDKFKFVLDMIVYQSVVASLAIVVGLFVSGEFRMVQEEMRGYELGKVFYVMNLAWTGVLWQVYIVGAVGLLFEVSALFSNVISTMGLPIAPVLAVIFLKDRMDGIKGIAMALALWGFISYSYQHYVDEFQGEKTSQEGNNVNLTTLGNESD